MKYLISFFLLLSLTGTGQVTMSVYIPSSNTWVNQSVYTTAFGAAPTASPTFTGTVTLPVGNAINLAGGTLGAIPYQSAANTTTLLAATATATKMLLSGASAAPTWSTSTIPTSAGATANKHLISDATNYVLSAITYPNAAGTVGQYAMSDGTNMVYASGAGQASITSASGAINNTETLIIKTSALAASRLQVGSVIRITLMGTCTSSAANVSTFKIRIGTAGTTSDGVVASAATSVAATTGTAVPFRMVFELTVTATGASAANTGYCTLENTGTTGISAQTTQIILPTFTTFNSTTANNIISCTYVAAAATTTSTFQNAYMEIVYK
jgi:hypothetical protein